MGGGEGGVEGDLPLGPACALVDIDVGAGLRIPGLRQRGRGGEGAYHLASQPWGSMIGWDIAAGDGGSCSLGREMYSRCTPARHVAGLVYARFT